MRDAINNEFLDDAESAEGALAREEAAGGERAEFMAKMQWTFTA